MIHKFPYYNLMMADPGENGGGGGDDGGGSGGGNTGPARLIITGVDCGEIIEVGSVGDYFPDGATLIPSNEPGELYPPTFNIFSYFNDPNFQALIKKGIECPGYIINRYGEDNYENSLNNPLVAEGGFDWGAVSQNQWNQETDIDFPGPLSSHPAEIFLNPRYWTSPLQALFSHNRELGLTNFFNTQQFANSVPPLIHYYGAFGSGYSGYKLLSPESPVVVTKINLRDFTNGEVIQTDYRMYWLAQTWSHIDPGPGLNGNPQNDFRLVTKNGTPINFGTFPNSTFGVQNEELSYDDPNGGTYMGSTPLGLVDFALPFGVPNPIIPFRKTPFSVSFDDCIPDGPDVAAPQYQSSGITITGEPREIKAQNNQFLNDWDFPNLTISTENIPENIRYISEYEQIEGQIISTGQTTQNDNNLGWFGGLTELKTGFKYLFELSIPFPQYFEEFDFNQDGAITTNDASLWISNGRPDITEYIGVNNYYNEESQPPSGEGAQRPIEDFLGDEIADFTWIVIPPPSLPPNPFPFDETLGFRLPRIFPFIKAHNINNSSQGFPNSGFHPGDLPNIQMIEAHNASEQALAEEYGDYPLFESTENWPELAEFPSLTHQKGVVKFQEWQQRWKEIGVSNTTLTINQFFIQDYDFAGVYTYDDKGFPTNHNTETFQQNLAALDNAINNPSIPPIKKQQALIMRGRYVLTGVPGEGWGQHLGPLTAVKQAGDLYVQGENFINEQNSLQILPEDTFSPLGPPAPEGYTPIVGPNCLFYFVPEPDGNPNIDFEPPSQEGHYPFYFSNGIDINRIEEDTTLGFANNVLMSNYSSYLEDYDISVNSQDWQYIQSLSQQFVDRVLWRWVYDTYNNALGTLTYNADNKPNVIQKLLQPGGLSEILADTNNTLDAQKTQNILTLHKIVNSYNALYEQQIDSEGNNGFSHPLQLFAPITGEWSYNYGATEEEVALGLYLNPHINVQWDIFLDRGWNDWIKLTLISLPTSQGGVQYSEFGAFIMYLFIQGQIFIPNNIYQGTPPGEQLPPLETTDIEYGTFYQTTGYTLSPGVNNITYLGPDFTGKNVWEECQYLNQSFNSFNGQIESVRFGVTSALIYEGGQILLPDGNEINGGFYPSNAAYPTEGPEAGADFFETEDIETVLKTGQTIQVFVNSEQPEFETTAFGNPISEQYGDKIFNSGTTLYTMIQTLKSDGYNGETLDINNDGSITLSDGESIANAYNDYRPYQMILFAQQLNMMDIIYQNFPPEGYVINPLTPDEMQNFDLPPIPDIFVEAAGSVKTFDVVKTFTSNRTRGYFKGNPAFGETAETTFINASDGTSTLPNTQGANALQNELGTKSITGNQIFTQSLNSSNNPYSFTIMDGDPDLSTSEPIFSVSFGHKDGSGSLAKSNNKSAAYAVYKQWANTLLGTPEGEFFTLSGSLLGTNVSPSANVGTTSVVSNKNPDKFIYVLSSLKKGDSLLDKKGRPDWKITLSGSNAAGVGVTKSFVSDIEFNPGGTLQTNGLSRYNIIEGTDTTNASTMLPPVSASYGHFYPDLGVWIFNEMLVNFFNGKDDDLEVNFNTTAISDNGLDMNGGNKSDKEYNNALKFVNVLKNNGPNKCIENLNYQNEERLIYCITKINTGEFNYSTNSTRNTSDGIIKSFNSSMDFDEQGDTSPTTFANSIQIYDANGYMVAVGKLSTPIKKDYNSEVVIKVIVPT